MRNSKVIAIAILMLTLSYTTLFSQEQLGLKLENYSGVNSLLLNPTYQTTSPFSWDINLVSAGVFFDNNYAYVRDASILDVINNSDAVRPLPDLDPDVDNMDEFLIMDYYDGNNRKRVSSLTTVMGPSLLINLKSGFSFGVFTNFRAAVSVRKLPPSLNYYRFEEQLNNEVFSVEPFKVATMAWSEIGFNLSRQIEIAEGSIAFGGNLKVLNGYEAAYFNNRSNFNLQRIDDDSLYFENLDVEFGYTNSNVDSDQFALNRNGMGVGLDLGFTYINSFDDGDYIWKAGAALVDIGRISFSKNAVKHRVITDFPVDIDVDDYDNSGTIEEKLSLFSYQTMYDSLASSQAGNFNIWLPAALTAYGDYRVTKNVYANVLLVQGLPLGENAIGRDNILALTPRYEHRWFGAMLPVSLYNYSKLRVGVSARLAFITIGSDNLGSFFKQSELTGSDIYVGIKVNPFKLNFSGGGRGNNKAVRCYHF